MHVRGVCIDIVCASKTLLLLPTLSATKRLSPDFLQQRCYTLFFHQVSPALLDDGPSQESCANAPKVQRSDYGTFSSPSARGSLNLLLPLILWMEI